MKPLHGPLWRSSSEILIRLLAAQAIIQHFAVTYRAIWGSQLTALERANTALLNGINQQFLETLFNQAVARDPQFYGNYGFDS